MPHDVEKLCYRCCKCQRIHSTSESRYTPHLKYQSKHGSEVMLITEPAPGDISISGNDRPLYVTENNLSMVLANGDTVLTQATVKAKSDKWLAHNTENGWVKVTAKDPSKRRIKIKDLPE